DATRRCRKALAPLSAMAQRRARGAWSAAAADAPQARAPQATTQGDVPTVRGDQRRQAAAALLAETAVTCDGRLTAPANQAEGENCVLFKPGIHRKQEQRAHVIESWWRRLGAAGLVCLAVGHPPKTFFCQQESVDVDGFIRRNDDEHLFFCPHTFAP